MSRTLSRFSLVPLVAIFLLAAPALLAGCEETAADLEAEAEADPTAPLYPVTRNERYKLDWPT